MVLNEATKLTVKKSIAQNFYEKEICFPHIYVEGTHREPRGKQRIANSGTHGERAIRAFIADDRGLDLNQNKKSGLRLALYLCKICLFKPVHSTTEEFKNAALFLPLDVTK